MFLSRLKSDVEVHHWTRPGLETLLRDRFKETHKIEAITSGSSNPNEIPLLASLPDFMKWSIASEGRPSSMTWPWMKPKGIARRTGAGV